MKRNIKLLQKYYQNVSNRKGDDNIESSNWIFISY